MKTILSVVFCLTFFFIGACKKKPSAGFGGSANLKVSAVHHNATIDSCTIYIKFNSSEAVALSEYDLNQKLTTDTNGNSYTILEGLKSGDYYIFAQGWDPSISQNVKGGIPYTIVNETDISVAIPVTEVH